MSLPPIWMTGGEGMEDERKAALPPHLQGNAKL